ncbi:GtrA family protein [Acetobacter fabarum]|uniref:GtrA family protein n=1 Tax=Acetobacter fabarum TaxID=483199 RepID=UPI0039E83C13
MQKQWVLYTHFLRFIIVGGIATIVNYLVFLELLNTIGVQYLVASSCGFLAGVLVGFPLNKMWTYQHASTITWGLLTKYGSVYLFSFIANICVLSILVGFFRTDARIANIIGIGFTTVTNFIGTKFWVFGSK